MSHPLDSAWAKLDRAQGYLNVLEEQTRPFTHAKPHEVTVGFDNTTSEYIFRVNMDARIPKQEWGLLIGDCVHNARSALDHATWQLAELCTEVTTPNDTRTQFPIFADKILFENATPRLLWRIHPNGKTMIEGLQPFNSPNPEDEPLWLLHTLDIADKHRYLVPTLYVVRGIRYWFVSDDRYKLTVSGHVLPGPLKENAEFGRLVLGDIRTLDGKPVHNPQVKVEGAPNLSISLEDWVVGRPEVFIPLIDTLTRGLMEVMGVLRHFDAHFQAEFGLLPY